MNKMKSGQYYPIRTLAKFILGVLGAFLLVIIAGNALACEQRAGLYLGAGLHHHEGNDWDDGGSVGGSLEIAYRINYRVGPTAAELDLGWWHNSQPFAGPPRNDDYESYLDQFGIKTRIFVN